MERNISDRSRGRLGFTLVELLVVVTIIAMLAGLMLVGINSARESARRATCLNNQKQLGTAIQSFAASKERLPGLVEKLTTQNPAWCHLLLPYIGENSRYEQFLKSGPSASLGDGSGLAIFVCTSSQRGATTANLTYVVNAGPAHCLTANVVTYPPAVSDATATPKYGFANLCLFIDRRDQAGYGTGLRTHGGLDAESFPDGLTNTVLLTENVQGGTWAGASGATTVDSTPAPPTIAATANIRNFGFLWALEKKIGTGTDDLLLGINSDIDAKDTTVKDRFRPSSRHPGIVQILMADGSVQSLSDDVEQKVYTARFCPDDKTAGKTTETGGLGWTTGADDWWK